MKERYKHLIGVYLNRKDAKHLMELLNDCERATLIGVKKQVEEGLAPEYEYEIKCADCKTPLKVYAGTKMSKIELDKTERYCSSCLDDFK